VTYLDYWFGSRFSGDDGGGDRRVGLGLVLGLRSFDGLDDLGLGLSGGRGGNGSLGSVQVIEEGHSVRWKRCGKGRRA